MSETILIAYGDLKTGIPRELPCGCSVEKKPFIDRYGSELNIVQLSNGALQFSVLLDRGMDIGEIYLGKEKISWEREEKYLLHPDNVDLRKEGWEKGFYAAVAAIGPEIFGTPDEIRTVHGTGSYSKADLDTVHILWEDGWITIEGTVPIKGYQKSPVYTKDIRICTGCHSSVLSRYDITSNLTGERQPLDDGYHIQLAGDYMSGGGSYILPVSTDKMLLRDSAPAEINPLEIYEFSTTLDPIRCYQYIPEPVDGLDDVQELAEYQELIQADGNVTAELIANKDETEAAFVIRPLNRYPRSLIAKRAIHEPMYALEPCRTRPNSLCQKAIDGELMYLEPYGKENSWILLGVIQNVPSISHMKSVIGEAAGGKVNTGNLGKGKDNTRKVKNAMVTGKTILPWE